MRRRPRDEPYRNAGKNRREERVDRDGFLLRHRAKPLEVPVVLQAGPAIFPIDEAKDQGHGINSFVDCTTMIAALYFAPISSGTKLMSRSQNPAS
jgi:hypothetical protein